VGLVRRHPLGGFLLLAFALSWGFWIPLALGGGEGSHVLGLLGPALAAVLVSAGIGGRHAVGALLAGLVRWRVHPGWYAVAFAPLVGGALGVGLLAVGGYPLPPASAWTSLAGFPDLGWLGLFLVVLLINGVGEETGWRGFAWPRLRAGRSLAGAAVLLAVPWALWHLPTFWLATGMGDLHPAVIPGWLVGLAAGAVVLGWIYERTGGSLLIVALFHASINIASATEATAGLPAAISSIGVMAAALVLLRRPAARPQPAAASASRERQLP
jgi:uncharacterized protein